MYSCPAARRALRASSTAWRCCCRRLNPASGRNPSNGRGRASRAWSIPAAPWRRKMTSTIGALGAATAVLTPLTVSSNQPNPDRIDFTVQPNDLLTAVRALVDEKWGFLTAIVGMDRPAPEPISGQSPKEGSIEILYV